MLGRFINHCEDSLTASVFTHLMHLPCELYWQILLKACYTTSLPLIVGESQSEPWPTWSARDTNNSSRVIPDLFLRFSAFDLIVEAKRGDDGGQNSEQWRNQVRAYANEYALEERPVKMIAIGGIYTNEDAEVSISWTPEGKGDEQGLSEAKDIICPVYMCRWRRLLAECQRALDDLGGLRYATSQSRAHQRILENLIDLFSWHGFQTGTWYSQVASHREPLRSGILGHGEVFTRMSSIF